MSTTTTDRPLHTDLVRVFQTVDPVLTDEVVAHSTENCPATTAQESLGWIDATDPARGWLCTVCIAHAPRAYAALSEAPRPLPTGVGGGASSTAGADQATDRQVAFLARLVAEKPAAAAQAGLTPERIAELTRRLASRAIDALLAAPAENAAPAEYRWTKVGGDWFVAGPEADDGATVSVVKKSGETVEAEIVGRLGTDAQGRALYRVRKAGEAERADHGPVADVPAGHYAIASKGSNDLLFVRVDRPTEGRWAGRTFVKMIVGGKPDAPIRGAQASDVLARIAAAGPDEAGALYGQEIGRCCRCNRTLTDAESRRLGIGPDCRTK